MTNRIEVLDKIMGSGKTTEILNWCERNPQQAFLYVTPLLSESEERVVNACVESKFIAPNTNEHRTKGLHLLDLLQSGVNVSITHEMYSSLKDIHLHWIKENEYVVILDEEVSFIEPFTSYTSDDFKYLKSLNQIEVSEDGKLVWLGEEIGDDTRYTKLANMCRLGMIYQAKRSESIFVTQLPMDLITCAKRVILITYLFKGSVMDTFVRMKGVEVVDFKDVEVIEPSKEKLINLIEFVGEKQIIEWAGESLSSSWYTSANQVRLTALGKSIRAIGNSNKATKDDLVWCTPSSIARPKKGNNKKIKPQGYSAGTGEVENGVAEGCFLPCSSRATNNYRNRTVMVHCYNRFPHVTVTSFLQDYGAVVDNNQFALAELLQWIWRSQIRDGKPIKICILSKRMRKIFQDWLYN